MKVIITMLTCLLWVGCATNHQHDGLYLANREVTGLTKAWILEGNALTFYSMGITDIKRCKQYSDRIEVEDGDTFPIDAAGDIVILSDSTKNVNYRMVKFSDRTNYKVGELDKIVSDAYEQERRNRSK
jgi:hypothetical protein